MRRIGENVRFYRNLRGLTQTALARKVQVAPAYISQIEANQRVPSLKVTRRIAEVLDLDLSVLVRETDPRIAQGRLTDSEKLDLLRTLMLSIESSGERDVATRSSHHDDLDVTELHSEPAFSVFSRVFVRGLVFGRESEEVTVESHVILEGRVWLLRGGIREEAIRETSISLDRGASDRLRAEAGTRVLSVYAPRIELAAVAAPILPPPRTDLRLNRPFPSTGRDSPRLRRPAISSSNPFQEAVRTMLRAAGEDPSREGLLRTPERVEKAWSFLAGGYKQDPHAILRGALFTEESNEMVIVQGIDLYSLCEHHLLPFFGRCHGGYLPAGRIVGLSKIPRVVDVFARRFQVQERLTSQIARAIEEALQPHGVAVVIEARHLCMMMRGVEKQNSIAVTSCMLGEFKDNPKTRNEFMDLLGRQA